MRIFLSVGVITYFRHYETTNKHCWKEGGGNYYLFYPRRRRADVVWVAVPKRLTLIVYV